MVVLGGLCHDGRSADDVEVGGERIDLVVVVGQHEDRHGAGRRHVGQDLDVVDVAEADLAGEVVPVAAQRVLDLVARAAARARRHDHDVVGYVALASAQGGQLVEDERGERSPAEDHHVAVGTDREGLLLQPLEPLLHGVDHDGQDHTDEEDDAGQGQPGAHEALVPLVVVAQRSRIDHVAEGPPHRVGVGVRVAGQEQHARPEVDRHDQEPAEEQHAPPGRLELGEHLAHGERR